MCTFILEFIFLFIFPKQRYPRIIIAGEENECKKESQIIGSISRERRMNENLLILVTNNSTNVDIQRKLKIIIAYVKNEC